LILKRPDGTTLQTPIGSLELPNPNPHYEVWVLLRNITTEEVPIGTEVWSTDSC
jgi:hypothetical protein